MSEPNDQQISKSKTMNSLKLSFLISAIAALSLVCTGLTAAPEPKSDAAGTQPSQKQFNTPKEAADSLVQAAESFDVNALKEILGPDDDFRNVDSAATLAPVLRAEIDTEI